MPFVIVGCLPSQEKGEEGQGDEETEDEGKEEEGKGDEGKNIIYEELEAEYERFPKHGAKVVIGDCSAK